MGTIITAVLGSTIKSVIAAHFTGKKQKPTSKSVKGLVQSKTIFGAVVMAIPLVFKMFGVEVAEAEAQIVFDAGFEVFGFIMVVVGRMGAKKKIG